MCIRDSTRTEWIDKTTGTDKVLRVAFAHLVDVGQIDEVGTRTVAAGRGTRDVPTYCLAP